MEYLFMFFVSACLGLLFALRTQAIVDERKYLASIWTFWSIGISALITVYIFNDVYQILPMSLGQAVGTWIVMHYPFFRE